MTSARVRLSTILLSIAALAVLLAFWRSKPNEEFLQFGLFEFLVILLAILLIIFTMMVVLAIRRR